MLFIKKHNELKLLFWLVAPIVACGFARYSHAQAPIIWEAPAASQNTNDIRVTDSPFLFAFNGGGSVNISGIEFTGGTFDELPSGMTFFPSSATADTAAAGLTESTGDSGYDALLNSMAYTTSGERTGSIEFSGLTTGQEYQIQLWFSDQRGNNRTMSFGDNGASAGGVNLAGGTVDFGQNVVGTFTAAGATQSLSLETNGFNNIHVNALTLAEVPSIPQPDIEPVQGSNWNIDTVDEWGIAIDRDNSNYLVSDGFAISSANNSVFQSRVQSFETKQTFQDMLIQQSKEWNAIKWTDTNDDISPGANNAMVFVTPGEDDYIVIDRINGQYFIYHSTDLVDWERKGVIGAGYRWVTTAEYHDGRLFIYHDDENDHDPSLVTVDYVAGSGEFFDANGVLTGPSDTIAVTDYGVVLDKPEITVDGTVYQLAGGSDNAIFRDPADGQFHMIYENWSHQNAQRFSWDSNIASQSISADGINGFIFDEATRPFDVRGNLITQDQATDPHSFTQIGGTVTPLTVNGIDYFVGFHPNRLHLFQLTDQLHGWGDHSMVKVGETYYLFVDDDSPTEGIGLGYWYGTSLSEPLTYGGRLLDNVHPDPDIGFAEGTFQLLVQGRDNDLRSFGPWTPGIEAQAGVDTDGDGTADVWTEWQTVAEQYSRVSGFAKAVDLEEARMDLSSLPDGYGIAFRLRSELSGVSFDAINITSVAAQPLGDFNSDGQVDCLDIDAYFGNIDAAATEAIAELDLVGDGQITNDDVALLIEDLVQTSNGIVGTFLGDVNCDGVVDVLGDAFTLVANLGSSASSYSQGDINLDGIVDVLGDAFVLIANLGNTNE